jgi:hypothetical protein
MPLVKTLQRVKATRVSHDKIPSSRTAKQFPTRTNRTRAKKANRCLLKYVLLVSTQKTLRGSTMARLFAESQLARKIGGAAGKRSSWRRLLSMALSRCHSRGCRNAFCQTISTSRNNSHAMTSCTTPHSQPRRLGLHAHMLARAHSRRLHELTGRRARAAAGCVLPLRLPPAWPGWDLRAADSSAPPEKRLIKIHRPPKCAPSLRPRSPLARPPPSAVDFNQKFNARTASC